MPAVWWWCVGVGAETSTLLISELKMGHGIRVFAHRPATNGSRGRFDLRINNNNKKKTLAPAEQASLSKLNHFSSTSLGFNIRRADGTSSRMQNRPNSFTHSLFVSPLCLLMGRNWGQNDHGLEAASMTVCLLLRLDSTEQELLLGYAQLNTYCVLSTSDLTKHWLRSKFQKRIYDTGQLHNTATYPGEYIVLLACEPLNCTQFLF